MLYSLDDHESDYVYLKKKLRNLCEKLPFRPRRQNSLSYSSRYVTASHSVPPSEGERLGKNQLAERAPKNLQAGSALLELPAEISNSILDPLDLISTIRLRQTCRSFYYHGQSVSSLHQSLHARKNHASYFARLCFAERSHTNKPHSPDMLICNGCRISHPVQCFSEENLKKQAEERMCLGQQGRLYISSEHSISFRELAGDRADFDVRRICPPATLDRSTPYITSSLHCQYDAELGYILNYDWRFDFDNISNTAEQLSKSLRGPVVSLCPHIKSNDNKMISALHKCDMKKIYDHRKATQVRCNGCNMHACIMLQSADPWLPGPRLCDQVVVHVTRFVGHLGRPMFFSRESDNVDDRKAMQAQWLTQIDKPSIQSLPKLSKIESPFCGSKVGKEKRKRYIADLGSLPQLWYGREY